MRCLEQGVQRGIRGIRPRIGEPQELQSQERDGLVWLLGCLNRYR